MHMRSNREQRFERGVFYPEGNATALKTQLKIEFRRTDTDRERFRYIGMKKELPADITEAIRRAVKLEHPGIMSVPFVKILT